MKSRERHSEISHARAERVMLKFILGGTIGLIALIVGLWATVHFYSRWQEGRLVRRAYAYFDEGNLKAASLTAQHVLESKRDSAPAARLMALMGERLNDRLALDWRRKVVQKSPDSVDDLLALVRCALQFEDVDLAQATLEKIPEPARGRADYHAAMASVARNRQQPDRATAEWSEAARLAPNEPKYQLELSVSQLNSADEGVRAAAESTLSQLRQVPAVRAAAARALLLHALERHENAASVLDIAKDLQSYPEASLQDKILYLDFLHQVNDPQFTSYLTALEKLSIDKPGDAAALISWMSKNNLNLLALDFTRTLPAEMLDRWPVPLAVAEISLHLNDWKTVESLTQPANWKQFDFLRHAYLARALREQDKTAASDREWAAAAKGAADKADAELLLVRTASEWNWTNESVDLLWSLAKRPEKQKEAYQTLYRYYAKNADTQGLYRVIVRLAEADPNNLDVQNNLAQVSLLLHAQMDDARKIAREIHRRAPENSAYAMTYAYSLLTSGDTPGAMKVTDSIPAEVLKEPAMSAYYGLCLAAAHDERAREYLERGKAATLLPQERELVENALSKAR